MRFLLWIKDQPLTRGILRTEEKGSHCVHSLCCVGSTGLEEHRRWLEEFIYASAEIEFHCRCVEPAANFP